MSVSLGALAVAAAKRAAASIGIQAARDPEKAAGCVLQIGGAIAGIAIVGALLLGALAAAVPSIVFGGADSTLLEAEIDDYLDLSARIARMVEAGAAGRAESAATTDTLTATRVSAPDWRYLVAIAAVECDQEFDQADIDAVERAVLDRVRYTTSRISTTPTETVVVTALYAPVGEVAKTFPLPGEALFAGREDEAAELYLTSLSSVNELGRYDPLAAGTGMTPEIAAMLAEQDVVIEPGSPVETALSYLGAPYVWGAVGPRTFDCSGLMVYTFRQHGLAPPRVSRDQARWGAAIPASQLEPGDLVFFGSPVYHVGMYIGGGYYVHAPHTGDVVRIAELARRKDFSAARRWDWQPRTAPVLNPRTTPILEPRS
ncbi:MAG: C40 family peptidase [Coriobacteriia bacterium]|nr:C40 family peptidase [Coriobacteriia bacterium]